MTVYQMEVLHRNIKREHRHRSTVVYSTHASESFNLRLHGILRDFSRDLANVFGDDLLGIVMGGSYGRGEAAWRSSCSDLGSGIWSGGQAPRDAIKLLLIVRRKGRAWLAKSQAVIGKYRQIIGVPILITDCFSQDELNHLTPCFRLFEWALSHVVLYGPEFLLDGLRANFGFIGDQAGPALFDQSESLNEAIELGRWILAMHKQLAKPITQVLDQQILISSYQYCVLKLVDSILLLNGKWDSQLRHRKTAFADILANNSWFNDNPGIAGQLMQSYQLALGKDSFNFCFENPAECRELWHDLLQLWRNLSLFLVKQYRMPVFDTRKWRLRLMSRLLRNEIAFQVKARG